MIDNLPYKEKKWFKIRNIRVYYFWTLLLLTGKCEFVMIYLYL